MNLRILPVVLACLLVACKDQNTGKSRGPIRLGDSATIVTEADPALLHDQVTDLQPAIVAGENGEAAPVQDTAQAVTVETPPANVPPPAANVPAGPGLNVPFKEATIFIGGIQTKSYGKPDLQKARGASYELTEGNLAGKQLRVSGGTVTRVVQRYETVVQLKDGNDKLSLESLGKYTSDWGPLTGSGGGYTIGGLDPSKLEFKDVSPNSIRNAVQQAARRNRLNRNDTQDWLDAVRRVRSASQAPAMIILRSVMWRIEGKDAAGKSFSKELRVDVPVP